MARRRRSAGGQRLLRLVLLLALLLVGAELLLPRLSSFGRGPVVVGSERFGHRLLGAQRALGEGGARERINALGYRERELGAALFTRREPDVLRVALLGGSAVYGRGVRDEALLARRIEEGLAQELARREDPRRAEVLSFVAPGYGLQALVRVWADHARTYKPDLVVLCLGSDAVRPVVAGVDPGPGSLAATLGRSALGDLLLHGLFGRERLDPERDPSPYGEPLARDPLGVELDPLWQDARERLPKLAEAVRASGSRLVALALATEPGGAAAAARWVELCGEAGIPCADPRPAFARDREGGEDPLAHGGRGLSAGGHRRAAEALLALDLLAP